MGKASKLAWLFSQVNLQNSFSADNRQVIDSLEQKLLIDSGFVDLDYNSSQAYLLPKGSLIIWRFAITEKLLEEQFLLAQDLMHMQLRWTFVINSIDDVLYWIWDAGLVQHCSQDWQDELLTQLWQAQLAFNKNIWGSLTMSNNHVFRLQCKKACKLSETAKSRQIIVAAKTMTDLLECLQAKFMTTDISIFSLSKHPSNLLISIDGESSIVQLTKDCL